MASRVGTPPTAPTAARNRVCASINQSTIAGHAARSRTPEKGDSSPIRAAFRPGIEFRSTPSPTTASNRSRRAKK
jgi:hypothetical protein